LLFKRSYNSSESYAQRRRAERDSLLECLVEGDHDDGMRVFELMARHLNFLHALWARATFIARNP